MTIDYDNFDEKLDKLNIESRREQLNSLNPVGIDANYNLHDLTFEYCKNCDAFHPEGLDSEDQLIAVIARKDIADLHRSTGAYLARVSYEEGRLAIMTALSPTIN